MPKDLILCSQGYFRKANHLIVERFSIYYQNILHKTLHHTIIIIKLINSPKCEEFPITRDVTCRQIQVRSPRDWDLFEALRAFIYADLLTESRNISRFHESLIQERPRLLFTTDHVNTIGLHFHCSPRT